VLATSQLEALRGRGIALVVRTLDKQS
jgi:hypothetical protein